MENDLKVLDKLIGFWVEERNLQTQDPRIQMCKMQEELGELAKGINKGNYDAIVDGIGDVFVVLKCLSMQLNLDLTDCVNSAYNEIKDRRGKLINGTFVKESDL